MGHPERVMPFCVRQVTVVVPVKKPVFAGHANDNEVQVSDSERLEFEIMENHQSRLVIQPSQPFTTDVLELRLVAPSLNVPAALFEVRCYATA